MDKKTQDRFWASLSKEERKRHRDGYKAEVKALSYNSGFNDALESVFGRHNLTSDTEPEEILIVEKSKVQEFYKNLDEHIRINPNDKIPFNGVKAHLKELFGDKCLPDKELNEDNFAKSEPSVQVEPKFKVGDKVRVIGIVGYVGEVTEIVSVDESDPDAPYKLDLIDDEGGGIWCAENAIEPYIEPEKGNKEGKQGNNSEIPNLYQESETKRKETQNLSLSERQNVETKDNMEEKELNLCELLKGCDETAFYSPTFSVVLLKAINEDDNKPLFWDFGVMTSYTYADGRIYSDSVPTIFPSRALYEKYPLDAKKAWQVWSEERKPKRWRAAKGDEYWVIDSDIAPSSVEEKYNNWDDARYNLGNYFRTEEEAQQAAEAVRECLEKFHQRTDM